MAWAIVASGALIHVPGRHTPAFSWNGHSDGKYHLAAENKYLDGVFVLEDTSHPVQLDSAGHTFAGFPKTAGGTYSCIFRGMRAFSPKNANWVRITGPTASGRKSSGNSCPKTAVS